MQVFIPYKDVISIAQTMWADSKRYNKQIIELKQIISAIEGAKAWRNHPVCLMYKEHKDWLELYLKCFELYKKCMEIKDNPIKKLIKFRESWLAAVLAYEASPEFLDNQELLDSHKRRLHTKSPSLYPQFEKYGTSEINWYYVNGEIVKYKDGKRIKE